MAALRRFYRLKSRKLLERSPVLIVGRNVLWLEHLGPNKSLRAKPTGEDPGPFSEHCCVLICV